MPHVVDEIKPAGAVHTGITRLLRIEDIADRLAVSRSMAWKLIALGELRSVRIGRAVRVTPAELEAYLARAARD
jgi:excisionase family DNA binding protein